MFRNTIRKTMSTTRPTAALVIACLALLVGMGGTSYAAGLITGKQVKNSTLTGKDLKDGSVSGVDVTDQSVTGKDLLDGTVTGPDVAGLTKADIAPNSLDGDVVNESGLAIVPEAKEASRAAPPWEPETR